MEKIRPIKVHGQSVSPHLKKHQEERSPEVYNNQGEGAMRESRNNFSQHNTLMARNTMDRFKKKDGLEVFLRDAKERDGRKFATLEMNETFDVMNTS